MHDILLGPRSLLLWTLLALSQTTVILGALWLSPHAAAVLGLLWLLIASLLLGLYLLARSARLPLTAKAALSTAAALAIGAACGLLRFPSAITPSGFSDYAGGTLTGLVIASDLERLTLAAPCLIPLQASSPDCDGPHHLTLVRPSWDTSTIPVGVTVRAEVTLHVPRYPNNPTSLPPAPPSPDRVHARALSDITIAPELTPPLFPSIAASLRSHLTFSAPSGDRATALYTALILGDRTSLAPTTRLAYQDTGTAHLLAISGFNLALFGFGAYRLLLTLLLLVPRLRTRPAPARLAATAAVLVSVLYTALIVPTDATDRALIAIVLTLGLFAAGVETRAPRTLALCFVTALLLDPTALTRAGFQLSFAATLSLILALPATRAVSSWVRSSPHFTRPITRRLAVGLAALVITDLFTYIATAPISLVWFGHASPHALWVNLIAIPWMALLVFPAGLLHLTAAILLPPLTGLTDPLTTVIGVAFESFIIQAGALIGSQQGATLPFWLGWPLAIIVLLASLTRPRRVANVSAATAIAAATLFSSLRSSGRMELHLLDVGHGDAIVIRHPSGATMLVDTGGAFDADASRHLAERTLIPALTALGVSRIDLLVITHADRDHIGAAPALADRLPIETLWLPPCAFDTPTATDLRRRVEASGGRALAVSAQEPLDWQGVSIEVLWPLSDSRLWDDRCDWDSNDASLVLRLVHDGRSVLLTGDVEAAAEDALVELHGRGLGSDVLKVPHHGSRSSSTVPFLNAVNPTVALVSGLPGRAPMPPHASILERYQFRNIPLFMTGRDGAVSVIWEDDGLAIETKSGERVVVAGASTSAN